MRNQLFLITFFLISSTLQLLGQEKGITLFETFENYTENKGVIYKGDYRFLGNKSGFKKATCKFQNKDKKAPKKEKKITIFLHKIWGFKFNNQLIRIDKDNEAYRVMSIGEIIYYENAIPHLNIDKLPFVEQNQTYRMSISKDLNSKMLGLGGEKFNTPYDKMKKFATANPEVNTFVECCKKKHNNQKIVRKCIEEFNGEKLPK